MEILHSLLESLRIDPVLLLVNGILFLILLQVLDKLFWKPMMKHLDQRKQDIAGAYKTVEDTRREMENLRSEYQTRMAQIEADARGRIQEMVRDAQRQREEMIAQARAQSEEIMRQGMEGVEQEKERTLVAMRSNLDAAAASALAKAVGTAPEPAQRRLIDEYLSQHVTRS